ncbi:hypothetical protein [Rhodomicrobium lacus]|uniref:hypothetical protein n=1 Tax=Rhodomicrobium lacus TaxID=2498452 RepID=UPI0013E0E560|nr:hypothetical protein [Rhodomicrobium lacus]
MAVGGALNREAHDEFGDAGFVEVQELAAIGNMFKAEIEPPETADKAQDYFIFVSFEQSEAFQAEGRSQVSNSTRGAVIREARSGVQ